MTGKQQQEAVVTTSKWLCYILRHRAKRHGLALWRGGWADLNQLAVIRGAHPSQLLDVAVTDLDYRFQTIYDENENIWWIRATPPEERWWFFHERSKQRLPPVFDQLPPDNYWVGAW